MWPFERKKRRPWMDSIARINGALDGLEEAGVPLNGLRFPLPPAKLWALNDKVCARLSELGVPEELQGTVFSFLQRAFADEIAKKTLEIAEKSGIDPDDEAAIGALSAGISVDVCCRHIGLEASPEEIRRTVEYARAQEQAEEAGGQ